MIYITTCMYPIMIDKNIVGENDCYSGYIHFADIYNEVRIMYDYALWSLGG